jgi:Epoxide hydrolase N terminus
METTKAPEEIDHDRRRLLGTVTMGIAAAGALSLVPTHLVKASDMISNQSSNQGASPMDTVAHSEIRPFRVNFPEEALVDLRRRIAATRWPDKETVTDESQGVQLATVQSLVRYWGTDYDWRKVEAKLNALPRFITEIMGSTSISFTFARNMRMPCQ